MDRQWVECYAQLVGTVLSLWEAAALDAAGGEEVPATYINIADASIKMVCPPPPKPPFFLNEPWEAFEALT